MSRKKSKWRDNPCLWVGKFNIVKISVLHHLIYRLNAIPIKIKTPATYFVETDNLILKLIWRGRRHRMSNTTLKEKNRAGEFDTTQLQDLQ